MSRWTLVLAGVLVLGGLSVRPALAQRVSFSISGHGHGHHYHHHHHGWHAHYGWDPYPWYPSYWYRPRVYVAPPAVTYVEPAPTVIVREVPSVSSAPAPAPRTAAEPAPTVASRSAPANSLPAGQAVTIRNPRNSGATVAFVVDGNTEVELAPGESKLLTDGQRHTIEFDRGGDYGTAERQLRGGAYDFVVTDNGWDLNESPGRELRSALVPSTPKKNALPRR